MKFEKNIKFASNACRRLLLGFDNSNRIVIDQSIFDTLFFDTMPCASFIDTMPCKGKNSYGQGIRVDILIQKVIRNRSLMM